MANEFVMVWDAAAKRYVSCTREEWNRKHPPKPLTEDERRLAKALGLV
jgi:hypothetical protein